LFGKRKQAVAVAEAPSRITIPDPDPETGLPGPAGFEESIRREIGRLLRYGGQGALAIFDITVQPEADGSLPPSPARFVAQALSRQARTSDVVARVGPTMFAVLLVEAAGPGARQFTERARTLIGSTPYARRADGSAIFARAWAGVAEWHPELNTVDAYATAAEQALKSTFRGYEAAQEWFRGEGTYNPA